MNLLKYAKLQTELQGKQHIRYLEDEYAKLWQMYGDLEDERDLLREAITHHRLKKWCVGYVHDREDRKLYAALQEDRDDG